MKTQLKVTLSLMLAALLLTVVTVAWAAEPQGRGGGLHGTVTAIDGSTLTVNTPQGEQKVVTDEQTRFRIKDVENPTLADLKVGDYILARCRPDAEGNLLARVVAVVPPERLQRLALRGEVLAVEGNTLAVKTPRRGEVSVSTDENTRFRVPGVENPTIADVEVGNMVLAAGQRSEQDGTFTARAVAVVPRRPLRRNLLRGQVTAVGDGQLTLARPDGPEVTVLITADTRFRIPGVEEPGLDDIEPGDRIGVFGQPDESGQIVAKLVVVPKGQPVEGGKATIQPIDESA